MKVTQILLVALAFGVALNAVEGRRPPPRKFPPPSPSPPPPKSPPPPPPPSPSPPPPPSPSPKPPPPPPPPASFEYPHTCKPGNIVPYGEGAGIDCTPYVVARDTTYTGAGWAFKITTRTAPKKCQQNCATMALGDVKFAINPVCRGSVNNNIAITLGNGESYTVSPNYGNDADDGYASDEQAPARTFRIKFKTALTTSQANNVRIVFSTESFNNRGCNNPAVFFDTKHGLPSGVAQYAYFSANKKCCGTALAKL